MENTAERPTEKTYENPRTASKMKWYRSAKENPEQVAKFKDQRRRYYLAHVEEERTRALERYYKRKAMAPPKAGSPGDAETPGTTLPA
jgi:hypothetical protein